MNTKMVSRMEKLTFYPSILPGLRDAAKLTQKELAVAVGVSIDAVKSWENGRRLPRPGYLRRMARALKCRIDQLVP